jgi:dTDP-glucose 4,6-dehydratase
MTYENFLKVILKQEVLDEQIKEAYKLKIDLIEFVEDRKGHDLRYSVDWSKSKNELGYEPLVAFEEGLSRTVKWYKENENWWKPLKEL